MKAKAAILTALIGVVLIAACSSRITCSRTTFKTPIGDQSDAQVRWERRVVARGWRYHIVRSVDQAKAVVRHYGLAL